MTTVEEGLDLGPSDADLVRQCLRGDNNGFNLLVQKYQRQVYAFCHRMIGNAEDASDVAQDSFLKAYNALGSFRQEAQFLTWMLRIAHNACIDKSRVESKHRSDSLDDMEYELGDDSSNPERAAIRSDDERRVWEAIFRLPEKYQTSLVMFHFDGKSIKDISGSLGKPEGTIKSDLHIAREMLRRKLEGVVR